MPRVREYYWITANYEGQDILIRGGETYQEAERKGYQELPCMFEVVMLPTTDIAAASRMIKGRKLEQTQDIGESLKRLRHTM